MSFFVYQGNLDPILEYQVLEEDGSPADINGKTVTLSMRLAGSEVLILDHVGVTVIDALLGKVEYAWQPGDTDQPGTHLVWVTVSGAEDQDAPEVAFPVYTHSVPWCSAADVARFGSITMPGGDAGALIDAALIASELLSELSARLFNIYRDTFRPINANCGCWGDTFASGIPPQYQWGLWAGGFWGWGSDGCVDVIGCTPIPRLLLAGYPVVDVNQVKVDGAVLNAGLYRVDEFSELVRTDGVWWPTCQNMLLPDTQPGTWSVDYTWGATPPRAGVLAAAELGAAIYPTLIGGDCALPLAVTALTRRGVRVERGLAGVFAKAMKDGGGFGLTLVDAFLRTYNPQGLTEQPTVWSPDQQPDPRRVNT